jgi:four helix bundle protein
VGSRPEKIESYRDLRVWQASMAVAAEIYRATAAASNDWKFALGSQTLRAATSVPANIAEGYGRGTTGAYVQFLRIARGSLKEVETHLLLGQRVGALPSDRIEEILGELDGAGRMLNALIRSREASRIEGQQA